MQLMEIITIILLIIVIFILLLVIFIRLLVIFVHLLVKDFQGSNKTILPILLM